MYYTEYLNLYCNYLKLKKQVSTHNLITETYKTRDLNIYPKLKIVSQLPYYQS